MKILIVEDELLIADQLEIIASSNGCKVIGIAQNVEQAVHLLQFQPDLVFVDIQLLDQQNGIVLGKYLDEKNISFIYITANNEVETLKEAIKTNPISYISKPFKNNDIIAALEMVKLKLELKPKITLKLTNKDVELFLEDILFCEAKGSYTEIVTKEQRYTKRINLKDFISFLDENFIRVHRSFVVNKNYITYQTSSCIFFDSIKIPVSKMYKENFN